MNIKQYNDFFHYYNEIKLKIYKYLKNKGIDANCIKLDFADKYIDVSYYDENYDLQEQMSINIDDLLK